MKGDQLRCANLPVLPVCKPEAARLPGCLRDLLTAVTTEPQRRYRGEGGGISLTIRHLRPGDSATLKSYNLNLAPREFNVGGCRGSPSLGRPLPAAPAAVTA